MAVPEPVNLSNTTPAAPAGSVNLDWQADSNIPRNVSVAVPVATTGNLGIVQPDGTTITISAGVISIHLTSAQIIAALGYTPANAADPTGPASAGTAHTHPQT